MNSTRRIFTAMFAAFLIAGMTNLVQAQGQQRQRPQQGQGERQRPQIDTKKVLKEQMKWFSTNFELSDDQTKVIEEIHKKDVESKKAVMESGLTPRDSEFREKMEGLDITKAAELEEVLTKEQWELFEEKKEEYSKIGRPERPQRQGRNG